MPRNPIGCLIMVLLSVLPCGAQKSRWENLDQIRAGTKVQVVEQNLKSTSGKFVRYSETDLTLKVSDQEIVIPRDKVYRVSISGKNRKRNALIGAGAGAALGLGTGLAIMEHERGFGGAVAGTTVGFAGVGAGIGALIPGSREIYRAEMSRSASVRAQLSSTDRPELSGEGPNEKP